MKNKIIDTDLVIVGGGTLGLFIYSQLKNTIKNIKVLDRGNFEPKITKTNDIINKGIYHKGTFTKRAFGIGGNSSLWGGQLAEFTKTQLAEYESELGLRKNETTKLYKRVYKLLNVKRNDLNNFVKDNKIKVKLVLVDEKEAITIEKIDIKPNDTLFLLDKNQNPDPWTNKAIFEPYNEITIDIDQDEQNAYFKTLKNHSGQIKIRSSIIKMDTYIKANSTSLGNKPIGKLAEKNSGITFTRSGRAFFDQSTNLYINLNVHSIHQ